MIQTKIDSLLLKEEINISNKKYNFTFNIIMLLGSIGFLIVGISSYLQKNLLGFLNANEILFFPQGITMCFYGIIGTIISIYQILLIYWQVGEGYNEFNKQTGKLTIFRKGFPGKNSEIKLVYLIEEIEAIHVKTTTNILNSSQTICICLKGKYEIPILQIRPPIKIGELEKKASELASFLKVPIKGS
uniref:photosystem I assembly protein Ycf4 n=1 Tax=Flexiglena variabilis TaxID=2743688 RepID=UPI0023AA9AB6|nr:photosystem I assembly protein Ycf4 [Flexiglena variabilis]WCH63518.1 photosystem I assembly protein Ycf4 [Flexiglena variabilis]